MGRTDFCQCIQIWNMGGKYHKHDANFNLLSGKKCRKDEKLTDDLNNGKSQLNQEMIPQREEISFFRDLYLNQKALWFF